MLMFLMSLDVVIRFLKQPVFMNFLYLMPLPLIAPLLDLPLFIQFENLLVFLQTFFYFEWHYRTE
jgi:hypothetical protein